MSYTALYRKYRPLTFSDVVGQDVIVKILRSSIINEKIGHAYLFSGPRGTGKTSVAKIFAKAVNCLTPKDGDICENCDMCKKLTENSIDIIEIDAASNNGVDEIREIRNNAKLTPTVAKYKVYIIDEVHMLSTGAFNALLKTLEEPPEHVIFILATTEAQKIPLTIISRCQRFDFKKIVPSILKERLIHISKLEDKIVNENVLDLVCKLSDGGLRDAINLIDQITTISGRDITNEDVYLLSGEVNDAVIEQLFDSVVQSNLNSGIDTINEIYQSGKNFSTIAERLLIFLRDITINNNIHDYFQEYYCKILNKYSNLSNELCKQMSKVLTELLSELKKSTNQKIIFEIYFINLCSLNEVSDKKETKAVKEEVKKPEKIVDIEDNGFDKLKQTRVNNALATADKSLLNELKKKFEEVENYISNKNYNNIAKLLLDSKIIVGSDDYIMLSFSKVISTDMFYSNLKQIEKLVEKIYKKKYNLVAITEKEWNNIKKEYIDKKKNGIEYTIIEETKELLHNVNSVDIDEVEFSAINIFGEESVSVKWERR